MNNNNKRTKKKFKVRVQVEAIVAACLESLYFDPTIRKVRITVSKNSNQEIEISLSGRGNLRGKITKDTADLWVSGTEEEVKAWEKFFIDFASVPEFSLRQYVQWAKGKP